ncbi:hypothetical protein D915_004473 [Fasciola hepatica]|uniref:Uncharacterized protein n=1 Tax=Fasciola hepatica TaxID=6192 RepID=A0A4E0R7G6_FASHE|nr:hypothetical protein D915_004473 [Fasciola hepatica]
MNLPLLSRVNPCTPASFYLGYIRRLQIQRRQRQAELRRYILRVKQLIYRYRIRYQKNFCGQRRQLLRHEQTNYILSDHTACKIHVLEIPSTVHSIPSRNQETRANCNKNIATTEEEIRLTDTKRALAFPKSAKHSSLMIHSTNILSG